MIKKVKKTISQLDDKHGMLTIIDFVEPKILPCGQKNKMALCKCDCGNLKEVRLLHLVRNKIVSCGCAKGEVHGDSYTKLYTTWRGMKNRCYGRKTIQPHLYKDKGIQVCEEWRNSYLKFKEWAVDNGYKEGLQIDRIDGSKGYNPGNCRFITPRANSNNRSVTVMIEYDGQKVSFANVIHEKELQSSYFTILKRITRGGWEAQRAIDTPIKR